MDRTIDKEGERGRESGKGRVGQRRTDARKKREKTRVSTRIYETYTWKLDASACRVIDYEEYAHTAAHPPAAECSRE